MAKKKIHPNKKIIILSVLLLSLLFGIWAVNYKTGIFNLNEKAGVSTCLSLNCTKYAKKCVKSGSSYQCVDLNAKLCGNIYCKSGEACWRNTCLPSNKCDNVGTASCSGNKLTICTIKGSQTTTCPTGTFCDSPRKACSLNGTAPLPTSYPGSCKHDCITSTQCTSEGGKPATGKCASGKICCKIDNNPPPPTDDPTTPGCDYDCVSQKTCDTYGEDKPGSCSGTKVCCDL